MRPVHLDALTRAAALDVVELPDEARELLVLEATRFLEAGGVLTLSEWGALSLESRAAFRAAARGEARPDRFGSPQPNDDGGALVLRKAVEDAALAIEADAA